MRKVHYAVLEFRMVVFSGDNHVGNLCSYKCFLQKKVDPSLQVEVKPSIRARKIQEEKIRRQAQKEEFWRRREQEQRWREEMRSVLL